MYLYFVIYQRHVSVDVQTILNSRLLGKTD